MDKTALLEKIFWNLQARWHLRRRPTTHELSLKETVKGLQHLLLDQQAAMLLDTLHHVFTSSVHLEDLQRLHISLYQEGADQRVWRAQATLLDGRSHAFGLIVAIPCIVFYTYLSNKENELLGKYEETINEVIHIWVTAVFQR